MANISSGIPPSAKRTFPNTKEGINDLFQAKKKSKADTLLKLESTQAELDTERLARIQAEQDRAALIQAMRNAGLPETTIEQVLKKPKIEQPETPHG